MEIKIENVKPMKWVCKILAWLSLFMLAVAMLALFINMVPVLSKMLALSKDTPMNLLAYAAVFFAVHKV